MSHDGFDFGPPEEGPIATVKEAIEHGTITSAQKQQIESDSHCKVGLRDRQRGRGREIFLTGRLANVQKGLDMIKSAVQENGWDKGREDKKAQEFHQRQQQAVKEAIRRAQGHGPSSSWTCNGEPNAHCLAPLHDRWVEDVGFWFDPSTITWWPWFDIFKEYSVMQVGFDDTNI